jgi:hypothetical protein
VNHSLILGLPRPTDLGPVLPAPQALPDWDRPHPPGLTWAVPLDPRPIVVEDHPTIRPVLAIDAGQFWTGARHGRTVGRTRAALDAAAVAYALAPTLADAPDLAAALAETAAEWTKALDGAAADWAVCLGVTA